MLGMLLICYIAVTHGLEVCDILTQAVFVCDKLIDT